MWVSDDSPLVGARILWVDAVANGHIPWAPRRIPRGLEFGSPHSLPHQ